MIHKGSLLSANELNRHYQKSCEVFSELSNGGKIKYLGLFHSLQATHLTKSRIEEVANPEYINEIFRTAEYSVEPRYIAYKLTEALTSNPRVNLILNTKMESVSRTGKHLKVTAKNQGELLEEEYDQVVNATWNGLLEIDRTMGIEPVVSSIQIWLQNLSSASGVRPALLHHGFGGV